MAACRRHGCPFHHKASPRRHGFCCNACRLGEEVHTCNCTGHHHRVMAAAAPQPTKKDVAAFTIPGHWACANGGILQHLGWYMNRLGNDGTMSAATRVAWMNLEKKMAFINQARPLIIHVLAEDSASPLLSHAAACRGLNARAPRVYNMWEVTGIDFDVQAVLVSQPLTAEILYDACRSIELQELDTFAFVCSHATHRSCGCAVLLAILVYQRARIVFSTNRTKRAAWRRGLVEEVTST